MYIRQKGKGKIIASVDEVLSGKMLREMQGQWQEKKFTDGTRKSCFVFSEFSSFGNDMIRIYINEGDYLSNED